ncbi:MAG TPA: oxidoreductase [Alcaligenes faecalis]|nr:oxidoreductase [Alcaligenes faecalis]
MSIMKSWIRSIRIEAEGIRSLELCPQEGRFPAVEAGAHIDVHLPGGLVRQYSLLAGSHEGQYRIGVSLDPASRGGSRAVHQTLNVGDALEISEPRNLFKLDEAQEATSVLLAGGIGITPIHAMAQRLQALGQRWHLFYCVRSRSRTAFLDELQQLEANSQGLGRLDVLIEDEMNGARMDMDAALAPYKSQGSHFYCCGPGGMLQAYKQACADVSDQQVHFEYFAAAPVAAADQSDDSAFTVHLARTGGSIAVPAGRSILECLLDQGIRVYCSCREGICGSCETKVLAGTPEHRDHVLSEQERAASESMMICVSRCRGEALTLDL